MNARVTDPMEIDRREWEEYEVTMWEVGLDWATLSIGMERSWRGVLLTIYNDVRIRLLLIVSA